MKKMKTLAETTTEIKEYTQAHPLLSVFLLSSMLGYIVGLIITMLFMTTSVFSVAGVCISIFGGMIGFVVGSVCYLICLPLFKKILK